MEAVCPLETNNVSVINWSHQNLYPISVKFGENLQTSSSNREAGARKEARF